MNRPLFFINAGHALDHLSMLIFPTALLGMAAGFGTDYSALIALAIGGTIAFGAGSLPAGWLGDHWSRHGMMLVFFFGLGAALIATSFAQTHWQLAVGLTAVGLAAAIYHPVGLALLPQVAGTAGKVLGVNGVWGNMGVAAAALSTGFLTQQFGWRVAFWVPGLVSILMGIAFALLVQPLPKAPKKAKPMPAGLDKATVVRAFGILLAVTIAGGVVFTAATLTLPKLVSERIGPTISALGGGTFGIGGIAAIIYASGALAQLTVGWALDRFSLSKVFAAIAAFQVPSLLLVALGQGHWLILAVVGVMIAIFGQVTVNDAMVNRYTDATWRGRIHAIRYLFSFGASAVAVPLIAFSHKHWDGFASLFLILAVLGGVVFIGALACPRDRRAGEGGAVEGAKA
ncbi:MFS transporter [Lacibacterium aquatile]|uniref:MFS transporter n=1 Tax=Lacibacterium aquatile TaxID=1168082 RepID=A0ABW5E0X8_9PROT